MFIGIGMGIPFQDNGTDWSSYWATLISATVENAAPTHVVLTFPTAQTSLGASDFTIAGFTIGSASWTGAVLTLVLSYGVTAYAGNLTITFVTTGETATVTNNVVITDTVGWYVAGDGSATYVTKDGSDLVSVWNDLSGANHPLNQATATNQPKWEIDGVLFDGVDDWVKTDAFTYDQPQFYYVVLSQISSTSGEGIIADRLGGGNGLIQQRPANTIRLYTGAGGSTVINTPIAEFFILRALFNEANSKGIINNNAPVAANLANVSIDGISIGTYQNLFGHIKVKEAIFRSTADSAATEMAIYNYLANKYGMTPI